MKKLLYTVFIILIISGILSSCGAKAPQPESTSSKYNLQTEATEKLADSPADEKKEEISPDTQHNKESIIYETKNEDTKNIQADTPVIENENNISDENDITDKKICSLSVKCGNILNNLDKLKKEKAGLIPESGIIYEKSALEFKENESVFELLKREMKSAKIHLEFSKTPAFNSMYIEGIANIYAFDVGELSGWMYKVNGIVPNHSCSEYLITSGDNIEFIYTCDSGRDIN